MYIIDPNLKTPLYLQLYNELKKDIINNLKPNDKLPSIRKIASTYNLSKNTVQNAYSQLYAEGYIDSYEKSGYFVLDLNDEKFITTNNIQPQKENHTCISYKYDFYPVGLSEKSFPLKLWKRLTSKAIDESLVFGKYSNGQGEIELREQISKYLIESRGVKCTASNIIISNGFSEAMSLVAKIMKEKYTTLAIEDPGYHIAKKIFKSFEYKINSINITSSGIDIKQIKKLKSKILYITPSHQYPTGVTIPITNRLELLKWAKNTNSIIIEDDYDSELSYINRPIPALQGLDNHDNVIYFGTFSKALSPTLRVSYMVVPDFFMQLYKQTFDCNFAKVSLITQKTLTLFLKDGHYEKHLRKLRTQNRKKHNLLKNYLHKYLKESFKIESYGAGLSILINPTVPFDMKKFKNLAEQNSIKLYFAHSITDGKWEAIRLGFGRFNQEKLEEAIKLLSNIWFESCIN